MKEQLTSRGRSSRRSLSSPSVHRVKQTNIIILSNILQYNMISLNLLSLFIHSQLSGSRQDLSTTCLLEDKVTIRSATVEQNAEINYLFWEILVRCNSIARLTSSITYVDIIYKFYCIIF